MGGAFLIAFLLVGLAELGDKSQLMLLGFAAKYRPLKVVLGAAIAIAILQAAGVLVGGVIGELLGGTKIVPIVAGVLFVVFGVITWRNGRDEDEEERDGVARKLGPVLTVTLALLIGEFGDKTQLMTMSIAADPAAALRTLGSVASGISAPVAGTLTTRFGVWLGSSLGFLAADAIAIVAGAVIGAKLPVRAIARLSAVIFVLFGLITFASAFVG